jgi:hypothetical protein
MTLLLAASLARAADPAPVQTVPLPYSLQDDRGSNWDVQFNGSIGDGGNDLYDGGGTLFDNEQPINRFQPQGRLDPARNEITVGPWSMGGLQVQRQVAVDAHAAFCRYAEVLENPAAHPVRVQLRIHFRLGSPVQQVETIMEPKGRNRPILGVAVGNGRNAIGIVGGGRGAPVSPRYAAQAGTTHIDLRYDLTVPPRQTIVIVHVEIRRGSAAEAADVVRTTRDRSYLQTLDPALRKHIVNFATTLKRVGEDEVFRGDALDVVEFTDGGRLEGTLGVNTYELSTMLGRVTIPGRRVICLLADQRRGDRRFRLVLVDGQVIAGRLLTDRIPITLANGSGFDVPVERIDRLGARIGPNEPETWPFNRPMLWLADGTRLFLKMPRHAMQLQTMYGVLNLPPQQVASVSFQPREHGPHEVILADGSHLSGLLVESSLDLRPADAALPAAALVLSPGQLQRLQCVPPPPDTAGAADNDDPHATLALQNGDELAGALTGSLHLTASFDAFDLNADEIRALRPAEEQSSAVQLELWDGTLLTGSLEMPTVHCALRGGLQLDIPISLIKAYRQPRPRPSSIMVRRIEQLVGQLDARSWRQREWAQEQLTAIGVAAIPVLKESRPARSPEALQRIELILRALEADDQRAVAP